MWIFLWPHIWKYPILSLTVIAVYCCSFSPPHHLCQHLFIFFIHTVCQPSHFSFVFALLPPHLALIVSFFPLFLSFCTLSKSPCHLSSLLSSIYICLFLPCPSLTSHSPFPSFICFLPVFPLCFSLSLPCSLAIPTLSVFLFLANHYSFSFVSSEALFCKTNPPLPPSLPACAPFSFS